VPLEPFRELLDRWRAFVRASEHAGQARQAEPVSWPPCQ
jgi:hypothetical protein